MDKSNRTKVMSALIVVLVVGLVWFLAKGSSSNIDKPVASNYYHGVFRNKKNPNMWGDDNGKPVPPPPDAIPYNPDGAPGSAGAAGSSAPNPGGHIPN